MLVKSLTNKVGSIGWSYVTLDLFLKSLATVLIENLPGLHDEIV